MSKALFSIGDVARITDWEHDVSGMKRYVGMITSIKVIGIDGEGKYWYRLNNCSESWREDWLEIVNKRDDMKTML